MNRFDSSDDFDDALALANSATRPRPAASRPASRGAPPAGTPGSAGTPGAEPRTSAAAAGDGPTAVSWASARSRARRAARAGSALTLPLHRALGHSLAAPLVARTDLPAFDTSAMDGWAVAGPGPWRLTGGSAGDGPGAPGVLAGDRAASASALADGYAVAIATGARVPAGATAVLRTEHATVDGDRLARTGPRGAGSPHVPADHRTDIRPRGQECRTGDLLLPAGTRVTPVVLGLAAAAGHDELNVTRRPRVEVLVLGAELTQDGVPAPGLVRDALGPMLDPWLTALGAEVLAVRHLGDDPAALATAVDDSRADVLLTTGGTAGGPMDHVRPLLTRIGARLLVDSVAVRPGHPMLLAQLPPATDRDADTGRDVDTVPATRSVPDAVPDTRRAPAGPTPDSSPGPDAPADGAPNPDAPGSRAPGPHALGFDALGFDAMAVDAPGADAPGPDAAAVHGPGLDAPGADAQRPVAPGDEPVDDVAPVRHLVGLPGNPLAAVAALLTLVEPLLRVLGDHEPETEPPTARLATRVEGHPTDTRLVPVTEREGPGGVRPLRHHGPAMLRGVAATDAMAVIPPGAASSAGSTVVLLRLPGR